MPADPVRCTDRPDDPPKPGQIVIFRDGTTAMLDRRKDDDSGWWCTLAEGQGGLADYVLDGPGWAVPSQDDMRELFDRIKAREAPDA